MVQLEGMQHIKAKENKYAWCPYRLDNEEGDVFLAAVWGETN